MQAPSFSCNSDIMQLVLSYLPRKMKFTLQLVSRSFGPQVAFKSLVSIRLLGSNVVTESNLFRKCIEKSRKVEKLHIEEAIIDSDYVNCLEKQLKSSESIFGTDAGKYFKQRVRELCLNNVQFVGETDIKRNYAVVRFVQVIGSFGCLQKLELQAISNAPMVF